MLADEYCAGHFDACIFYFDELAKVLSVMVSQEKGIPQHISNWYKDNVSAYL